MTLYGVIIHGVYPRQLATVSESKAYAEATKTKIINKLSHLSGLITVQKVDSFYPAGFADADTNIHKAMEA